MPEITTAEALRKVKEIIKNSPQVEQDISKWYDVYVTELEPGQWKLIVNDEHDQVIYFSYYELSLAEIHAARGYTQEHPKGTGFNPTITIDTPKGRAQPGPFAAMSMEQVEQQVRDAIEKVGIPKRTPAPPPTLGKKIAKLIRMIRLRLRL
jgi:hypothetical protein